MAELAYTIRETSKNRSIGTFLTKQNWIQLYNMSVKLVKLTNTMDASPQLPFMQTTPNFLPPEIYFQASNIPNASLESAYLRTPSLPQQTLSSNPNEIKHDEPSQRKSKGDSQVRCCQMCFVTESSVWRTGPNGQKTLCNACGLYYSKRQRHLKFQRELKEKELAKMKQQSQTQTS